MSSKERGEIYKLSRLHRGPRGGAQATSKPGSLQMASLIMQGIENSQKMVCNNPPGGVVAGPGVSALAPAGGSCLGKPGANISPHTVVKTWDERIGGRCPLEAKLKRNSRRGPGQDFLAHGRKVCRWFLKKQLSLQTQLCTVN
jgi:hypothetical protein